MCDHPELLDDMSTGDIVCTGCGSVITDPNVVCMKNMEPKPSSSVGTSIKAEELYVREYLVDICSFMHIDNSLVVDTTLNILKELGIEAGDGRILKNQPKFAFALWEALNRLDMPRNPKEIAYYFYIRPGDILKEEKKLQENNDSFVSSYKAPSAFVSFICGQLMLPFFFECIVCSIVKNAEENDDWFGKPESLIVATILYVRKSIVEKITTVPDYLTDINIVSLSSRFDVCRRSIHELMCLPSLTQSILVKTSQKTRKGEIIFKNIDMFEHFKNCSITE